MSDSAPSTFKSIMSVPKVIIDLEANQEYSFYVYGSVFIDAKPVEITGFVDDVEVFSGKGVFATFGSDTEHDYKVVIKSTTTQRDVTIIANLDFPIGYPCYITTKNNITKFNLLQEKKFMTEKQFYLTTFFQLGLKSYRRVTIETDDGSKGEIDQIDLESIPTEIGHKTEKSFSYYNIDGLLGAAIGKTSSNKFYLSVESYGDEWVTAMDGFVTIKENYVYKDSDFKALESNGKKKDKKLFLIIGIAAAVIVVIIIIAIVICCCMEKKAVKISNEETYDQKTSDAPQYPHL
jgi:hypothetical protein